jgi:hypothetical protein
MTTFKDSVHARFNRYELITQKPVFLPFIQKTQTCFSFSAIMSGPHTTWAKDAYPTEQWLESYKLALELELLIVELARHKDTGVFLAKCTQWMMNLFAHANAVVENAVTGDILSVTGCCLGTEIVVMVRPGPYVTIHHKDRDCRGSAPFLGQLHQDAQQTMPVENLLNLIERFANSCR